MKRRKFLIGAGSIAAGSAAAMGTGAFSSVEADRNVSVTTAGDASAYLKLSSDDTYISNDNTGSTLSLDIGANDFYDKDGNQVEGSGLNRDAVTRIDRAFTVTNQGPDDIILSLSYEGDGRVLGNKSYTDVDLSWAEGVYFDRTDGGQVGPGGNTPYAIAVVVDGAQVPSGTLTISAERASDTSGRSGTAD